MKKQLVFLLLLISISASQDLNCRQFSYDDCDFDKDSIINSWTFLQSSQECQDMCDEDPNCETFRFNLQNGYCYTLKQKLDDFIQTCGKFVGPDSPELSECIDNPDQCLRLRQVYCIPQGDHYENLQNITSLENCQKACNYHVHCNFFSYQADSEICELFEGQDVNCELLIGEKWPSVTDCDDNIIITTTAPPSTTTTPNYIQKFHLQLEIIDATNAKPLIKAEVNVDGVKSTTDQQGLVDFPGPFDLNQTVKITVKAFGYYDKIMDGFQLDSLNVTSNEIIFGTIPMTRKHNEVLLQIDLDYEMSKFGLMELNVVEVNNDFFMICQSTTSGGSCADVEMSKSSKILDQSETASFTNFTRNNPNENYTIIFAHFESEVGNPSPYDHNAQVQIQGTEVSESLLLPFYDFQAFGRKYWIIGCLKDGDRNFADFIKVDKYDPWDPTTKLDSNLCTSNSQVVYNFSMLLTFLTFTLTCFLK